MAFFKLHDWVQVIPSPDLKWSGWTDVHNNFCGKVGQISDIWDDPANGETLYNVTVSFPNGIAGSKPGNFYIEFISDHLILSTQYDSKLSEHLEKVERELQEWESFKRKAQDDALRKVFGRQNKSRGDTSEIMEHESKFSDLDDEWEEKTDEWEEITKEIIPLPGSVNHTLDDDIDYLLDQYASDPDYPYYDLDDDKD